MYNGSEQALVFAKDLLRETFFEVGILYNKYAERNEMLLYEYCFTVLSVCHESNSTSTSDVIG